MEINNLKDWIDRGFVLHNKCENNFTVTIRKQPDGKYRFFYGVVIERREKIVEKDWETFVKNINEFLVKNGVEL